MLINKLEYKKNLARKCFYGDFNYNAKMKKLLIHHWDTDGIASATLLLNKDSDIDNMIPEIGNYFLTEEEIKKSREYEEIYIVDFALNEDSLKKLIEFANVTIIDHHLTKKIDGAIYINPILDGKSEEEYPSASWIMNEYIGKEENLLAFLGAVGDWEERLKKIRFYKKLEKFMNANNLKFEELQKMVYLIDSNYKIGDKKGFMHRNNLKFEELQKMVYLIDSNYKIGDKKGVEKAVIELAKNENAADYILNNKKWHENMKMIEKEIENAINADGIKKGNALIKEINSKYNIISTVARKLSSKEKYVVVVNKSYFSDKAQLYVRGKNVSFLIERARSKGYIAGGKKDVMGAIIPMHDIDKFIEKIVHELNKN